MHETPNTLYQLVEERNAHCTYLLSWTMASNLNQRFNVWRQSWDDKSVVHPFTHAKTAAAQERKSIVQPHISSAKGNSAVMANDTMPVVVLFVPCAMFMRVYQDGGGGIKAWSGLRQLTLLSSPLEEQLFWRCKFLLAHRNTGRRGFRHPPSYHNAVAGWEEANLPCLNFPHVCAASESGIWSFADKFVLWHSSNFETWDHESNHELWGLLLLSPRSCVIFKRSVNLRNHLRFLQPNMAGTFPQNLYPEASTYIIHFLFFIWTKRGPRLYG